MVWRDHAQELQILCRDLHPIEGSHPAVLHEFVALENNWVPVEISYCRSYRRVVSTGLYYNRGTARSILRKHYMFFKKST